MAIKAQRNRAKLHILRDNVHRAKRDVKLRHPGAAERLKAHLAARLAYAETAYWRFGQLTYAYRLAILMHMRTTLIIDDGLLGRARQLTGLHEKTAIVHAGLEALIARESARRLAALGGSEPRLRAPPRRRSRTTR